MEKKKPSKKAYLFIAISSILSIIGFISLKKGNGYEWLLYIASIFAIIAIILTFKKEKPKKDEL